MEKIRDAINYLFMNWGIPWHDAKDLVLKHRIPWKQDELGFYVTKQDLDAIGKFRGSKTKYYE